MNTAPLFALAILLALPAAAQVQTPAAGYIDVPQAAQEVRTQAERARDRKLQHALSRIAPAAGDPAQDMRPHILSIGARARNHNLSDAKHPVAAQPWTTADSRRGIPFSITTTMQDIHDREFDDRPACEAAARWWLENVLDPEQAAVACLPRGTRR